MKLPQSDRPLEEMFANPPAESRIIKIVHSWPDDAEAQNDQITKLIDSGFGGVVCNVSFDQYLESEEKWSAFVNAVKKAKDLGMSLWLYDEKGYPSGTAGGITMRGHPEWEARGLLVKEACTQGGLVTIDLPPGKIVMAAAYAGDQESIELTQAVDLSAQIKDGRLEWDAPKGNWHVFAITEDFVYESTHAAISLADKLHYINLLMPEPTSKFLEVTYGGYSKHLGNDLGRWFRATFTDEPSLMSYWFNKMPYRILPWAPNLPVEFMKRRGYALEPLIPALVCDAGEKGKKARYDFWLTVAELTAENFFGQIQEYCHKHNLLSGGHLLMEEPLSAHVSFYGDFFRCIRRLDAPGIDCLTSIPAEVPWHIARLVGSAAELDGRTIRMCETSDFIQRYRPPGDTRPVRDVTESEIRGTCNRLMVNGINTITSYYSFADLSSADLKRINEYVGRCCMMLTGGHQVADIAVVYPIESVWPRFTPAYHGATDSQAVKQVQEIFDKVGQALWNAGRDFTYIDSRTLRESNVRKGELVHGDLRWKVVILPCVDTLPLKAWQKLAEFVKAGGIVVAVGAKPTNTESEFPSRRVQILAETVFAPSPRMVYIESGSDMDIVSVINSLLKPDIGTEGTSPIRSTHRRSQGHDLYFVINDSGQPWEGIVNIAKEGECELWNPMTGAHTQIGSTRPIKLALGAYEGIFLRFRQ